MANCKKCNVFNEYQDVDYLCYSCKSFTTAEVEVAQPDIKVTSIKFPELDFKLSLGDEFIYDRIGHDDHIKIVGYLNLNSRYAARYVFAVLNRKTNFNSLNNLIVGIPNLEYEISNDAYNYQSYNGWDKLPLEAAVKNQLIKSKVNG